MQEELKQLFPLRMTCRMVPNSIFRICLNFLALEGMTKLASNLFIHHKKKVKRDVVVREGNFINFILMSRSPTGLFVGASSPWILTDAKLW